MLLVVSHYTLKTNNPHINLSGYDFVTFGNKENLSGQVVFILKSHQVEKESECVWEKIKMLSLE